MTHKPKLSEGSCHIVLETNINDRMYLGIGWPENHGIKLKTGKFIDNTTFNKNYPGSRICAYAVDFDVPYQTR